MGWSKVKKALNSTLGTDEFKPLDKLIMGNKALKASDNFYSRVLDSYMDGDKDAPTIITNLLVMNWSGTCKFIVNAKEYNSSSDTVIILKNGVKVDSITFTDYDYKEISSKVMSFKKGDVFGLQIEAPLNYVDIYADVTDLSAFTILEV